jgi:hypothetical protein
METTHATNSKTIAPAIYFERSETVHEQSVDANVLLLLINFTPSDTA